MERSWKSLLFLTLLIASTQGSTADIGSFFNSLGNTLKDAGNTVKDGTETAFQVVKNTTVDAANATGDAFKEGSNAIADGAKSAYNKTINVATQQWDNTKRQINTLEGVFQDVGHSLNRTVFNFKDSAMKELRPVSDDISTAADRLENTTVRVVSDGVSGIVYFGNATWNALDIDSASSSLAPAPAAPKQVVGVDATSAQSVLTVLAQNSTAAFADYAQSIVVAVAEAQSTNVSTAVADVIGSETPGNMSEVSLGLGKAFGIAMIAAGNAAVQRAALVNSTLVAEAYVAGLQDTVSNCTVHTSTSLPPDSQAWFQFYADRCCGSVTDALAKMSLIMQQVPDKAASNAWFATLGSSYEFGKSPVFNLARCLAADKSIVNVEAS